MPPIIIMLLLAPPCGIIPAMACIPYPPAGCCVFGGPNNAMMDSLEVADLVAAGAGVLINSWARVVGADDAD